MGHAILHISNTYKSKAVPLSAVVAAKQSYCSVVTGAVIEELVSFSLVNKDVAVSRKL